MASVIVDDILWMFTFLGLFSLNDVYIHPWLEKAIGLTWTITIYSLVFFISIGTTIYLDRSDNEDDENEDGNEMEADKNDSNTLMKPAYDADDLAWKETPKNRLRSLNGSMVNK
jgi:hypothetical protein